FRGVLRYAERLAGHDAALRVLGRLRVRTYEGLARTAPRGPACGEALSRFAADVDTGLDILVRVLLPYTAAALAGGGAVALVSRLLPVAGAVLAAGLLAVCLLVPVCHHALAGRAERRVAPLRGELAAGVVELMHGLPDLTAYDAVSPRLAALDGVDSALNRAAARASGSVGMTSALVVLFAGGCVWLSVFFGAQAVRAGRLDGVLLAVVVLTPLAAFEVVAGLPLAASRWGAARSALRRVFALADAPDPVPVVPPVATLPAGPYHLRIEGVAARWAEAGPDVFAGLTLDLRPGRRVAVVGPSGCGKSTLAALLVRFADPSAGRITLNGTDLRHLCGDEVRRVVGLMGDDPYCFDTSLAENLRLARREASDDDLASALRRAGLLPWVESLPAGLATPVGEHGARLSGGQRRRLALARALLADPPILVLDEPTEHVDDATAQAITDDLLDATTGRTIVLITHRPYGLDRVDEVVRMAAAPATPR
ncbi:MAG: thiol reductant ABC exporter subunit CydC, partial [Frankia sp.]